MTSSISAPVSMIPPGTLRAPELAPQHGLARTRDQARLPSRSGQALYEELLLAIIDTLLDVDIYTLNGLLQGDALHTLKRKDVLIVGRLCWAAWQRGTTHERQTLSEFVAILRSLYPCLPLPHWVTAIDPESM